MFYQKSNKLLIALVGFVRSITNIQNLQDIGCRGKNQRQEKLGRRWRSIHKLTRISSKQ